MRKLAGLTMLTVMLAGCGMMHRVFGTSSSARDYSPGSTAVWGTWVLRSPDSTSFVGADQVRMELQPGSFALTASYPGRAPLVVNGTANMSESGLLTLTPASSLSNPMQGRALNFTAGKPIALLASAAGNTLVFAPARRDVDPTPSSVWHRLEAAEKAGFTTAQKDSAKR